MLYSKEIAQDVVDTLIDYIQEEMDGRLRFEDIVGEEGGYADLLHRFEQTIESVLDDEEVEYIPDVSRKPIELPDPEEGTLASYVILEQFPAQTGELVIAKRISGQEQYVCWLREREIFFNEGIVFPALEDAELYCLRNMKN